MPRRLSWPAALALAFALSNAHADETSLRARLAAPMPLEIRSRDDGQRVFAEVYGVLPFPFDAAVATLKDPANWCAILMLHLDTKECRVIQGTAGTVLQAGVVTHYDQPAASAYRVEFRHRLVRETPDYFEAGLDADDGPLDARDFRIVFEGMRTPEGSMLAHMSYAYTYGGISRFALAIYLATFGRNKVGFTVTGEDAQGHPHFVDGMRGVVERNTMRYYLAAEAWLRAGAGPRDERVDRALHAWWAAVERYPRQLHELDEPRYMRMKRGELGLR